MHERRGVVICPRNVDVPVAILPLNVLPVREL